jgi:hypothetical protein
MRHCRARRLGRCPSNPHPRRRARNSPRPALAPAITEEARRLSQRFEDLELRRALGCTPGVFTSMYPVVAPVGTTALTLLPLSEMTTATVPLKVTTVALTKWCQ